MDKPEEIKNFHMPAYNEIPDVGLYLEQTVRFASEYLRPFENISITNSMVSNYVKSGLISNPIKKQYNREQIAYVLFIAVVKTVLSLDQIRALLSIQRELCDTKAAYERFCMEFENALDEAFSDGKNGVRPQICQTAAGSAEDENADELMLLRRTMIAVAQQIYLEKAFAALASE